MFDPTQNAPPSYEAKRRLLRSAREYAASQLLNTFADSTVEQALLMNAIVYTKELQKEDAAAKKASASKKRGKRG